MDRMFISAVVLVVVGCAGPVMEKPPCDEATLAQIMLSCGGNEEACNKALDERDATCAKRIQEEP